MFLERMQVESNGDIWKLTPRAEESARIQQEARQAAREHSRPGDCTAVPERVRSRDPGAHHDADAVRANHDPDLGIPLRFPARNAA